jgi:hypothetical protein
LPNVGITQLKPSLNIQKKKKNRIHGITFLFPYISQKPSRIQANNTKQRQHEIIERKKEEQEKLKGIYHKIVFSNVLSLRGSAEKSSLLCRE